MYGISDRGIGSVEHLFLLWLMEKSQNGSGQATTAGWLASNIFIDHREK